MKPLKLYLCAFALAPMVTFAQPWMVDKGGLFSKGSGAVIYGYDPVAYFKESKAVKGNKDIHSEYQGGLFYFANEADKALFEKNPEKYVPQYGGYCAFAIGAKNKLVKIDPTVWTIIDGKLYLNYSASVKTMWSNDMAHLIKKGDANWQAM